MKSVYLLCICFLLFSCNQKEKNVLHTENVLQKAPTFGQQLSDAAISIIDPSVDYDPAYFSIKYPDGDVPKNKGVCTDVIIRSYRKLGIDLQKEVH